MRSDERTSSAAAGAPNLAARLTRFSSSAACLACSSGSTTSTFFSTTGCAFAIASPVVATTLAFLSGLLAPRGWSSAATDCV